MLVFDGLVKRFGALTAVDHLSFDVMPGRVTGFLGPNGAGKTTSLRIATRLVKADAGQVTFNGRDYRDLRKPMTHVGVALEATTFHPGRSARQHLMMLAPYAGVGRRRVDEVLDFVGLADVGTKRVGQFSLGMRGRLNLAVAMLGDPAVLLLDEPVNGLDPEGIRWIRDLLQALAKEGRTVLTSSHLLSEVEQTVDEVIIIAHGQLRYQGRLDQLEATQAPRTLVETSQRDALLGLAQANGWRVDTTGGARAVAVTIEGPTAAQIGAATFSAGIVLDQLASQATGLEEVFFSLTEGREAPR